MKTSSLLLAFFLAACGSDPVATTDGGHDAAALIDASADSATSADAGRDLGITPVDAGHDAGSSDAGASDAGASDAGTMDSGGSDAGADAATSDGGAISMAVRTFAESMLATQMNFVTGQCHCQYSMLGFTSEGECESALAPTLIDDCYLMAYTAQWDVLEERLTCFQSIADNYYACIAGSECASGSVMTCDDAYAEGFSGCLDIASDASSAADDMCAGT